MSMPPANAKTEIDFSEMDQPDCGTYSNKPMAQPSYEDLITYLIEAIDNTATIDGRIRQLLVEDGAEDKSAWLSRRRHSL